MKYFSNIPIINYSDNFVRNILTRAKILNNFKDQSSVYYPYVLKETTQTGLKYENLAYDYYNDIDDVWIIYLTNQIVDPYYDVPLSTEQFNTFIDKKYGSMVNAYNIILFYRNNYDQDDSILTLAGYNALPSNNRRYWTPSLNYDNQIIGYSRIQDDIVINTNKIISIPINNSNSKTFILNEKVEQVTSGATGFITFSNTSVIYLQHIGGGNNFNGTNKIVGLTTGAETYASSIFSTLKENIDSSITRYYSPVNAFDRENELNEKKKTILLLNSNYTSDVHNRFSEIMNN